MVIGEKRRRGVASDAGDECRVRVDRFWLGNWVLRFWFLNLKNITDEMRENRGGKSDFKFFYF